MLLPLLKQQTRGKAVLAAPSVVNALKAEAPIINHSPLVAHARKRLPNRTGVLAYKQGMMPFFDAATGNRFGVTVLQIDNAEVLMHRTAADNGYYAVQVGCGNKHPEKLSRQMLGHFASIKTNPKADVSEFRVKNAEGLLPVGTQIKPSFFTAGQYVDIQSVSKGKGFQGVMKRHNFHGLRASHGTSISHRSGGSYGMNQTPGRVLPGKKMPGHMGVQNVTIQNVKVVQVDDEMSVLLVKGPVSGAKGSLVKIQDAIKK